MADEVIIHIGLNSVNYFTHRVELYETVNLLDGCKTPRHIVQTGFYGLPFVTSRLPMVTI